jgi:hypothetical protein
LVGSHHQHHLQHSSEPHSRTRISRSPRRPYVLIRHSETIHSQMYM